MVPGSTTRLISGTMARKLDRHRRFGAHDDAGADALGGEGEGHHDHDQPLCVDEVARG